MDDRAVAHRRDGPALGDSGGVTNKLLTCFILTGLPGSFFTTTAFVLLGPATPMGSWRPLPYSTSIALTRVQVSTYLGR